MMKHFEENQLLLDLEAAAFLNTDPEEFWSDNNEDDVIVDDEMYDYAMFFEDEDDKRDYVR